MKLWNSAVIATAMSVIFASSVFAQDSIVIDKRSTVYFGFGQANSDNEFDNDDAPLSFGFMRQLPDSKTIIGFDVGLEGTMIDSTWGQNDKASQAMSLNLLVGANLYSEKKIKVDGALLLGIRESFSDCPDSFLGYQCYADTAPSTEYEGNFGVMLTGSYDSLMLGLRATAESVQVVTGFRF